MTVRENIIETIRQFDTKKLSQLLDENKTYADVPKKAFIEKLDSRLAILRKHYEDNAFKEVIEGQCNICVKGCFGCTFLSDSGNYIDMVFEGTEDEVTDIYSCTDFSVNDKRKVHELFLHFMDDEKIGFEPDVDFLIKEQKIEHGMLDLDGLKGRVVSLDELEDWHNAHDIIEHDIFSKKDYKAFELFESYVFDIGYLVDKKKDISQVEKGFLEYENSNKSDRDLIVWTHRNSNPHLLIEDYMFTYKQDGAIIVTINRIDNLYIDFTSCRKVLEFQNLMNKVRDYLDGKFKPGKEYFERNKYIDYSLSAYLHNKGVHLDLAIYMKFEIHKESINHITKHNPKAIQSTLQYIKGLVENNIPLCEETLSEEIIYQNLKGNTFQNKEIVLEFLRKATDYSVERKFHFAICYIDSNPKHIFGSEIGIPSIIYHGLNKVVLLKLEFNDNGKIHFINSQELRWIELPWRNFINVYSYCMREEISRYLESVKDDE